METIGICLRCGRQFDGDGCPSCDEQPQEPAVDLRARSAWQQLKDQGLPVPEIPWTQVAEYYRWLEGYQQGQRGVAPSGNRWIAPGLSIPCGVPGCTGIGGVRCRSCGLPACGEHAEWTLSGLVCGSCLPAVPPEYRD